MEPSASLCSFATVSFDSARGRGYKRLTCWRLDGWSVECGPEIEGGRRVTTPARCVLLLVVVASACGGSAVQTSTPTPVALTPVAVIQQPQGLPIQTLQFGQPLDVTLDTLIRTGQTVCERGEDPNPCAKFEIDVPRSGTLRVQMQFVTSDRMFIYMYRPIPGNVTDLQDVESDQAPLVAESPVDAGVVYVHAGPYLPWGRAGQVKFQLLATLR
jgi:hypothetical protein